MKKIVLQGIFILGLGIICVLAYYALMEQKSRVHFQGQVEKITAAYEGHLYAEYRRTICGLGERSEDARNTTDKDEACIAGIKMKAKAEAAQAAGR